MSECGAFVPVAKALSQDCKTKRLERSLRNIFERENRRLEGCWNARSFQWKLFKVLMRWSLGKSFWIELLWQNNYQQGRWCRSINPAKAFDVKFLLLSLIWNQIAANETNVLTEGFCWNFFYLFTSFKSHFPWMWKRFTIKHMNDCIYKHFYA